MKTRGKTRSCLKNRETLGYFTNLDQELKMDYTQGFKEMLIMSYEDFKKAVKQYRAIHYAISSKWWKHPKGWPSNCDS